MGPWLELGRVLLGSPFGSIHLESGDSWGYGVAQGTLSTTLWAGQQRSPSCPIRNRRLSVVCEEGLQELDGHLPQSGRWPKFTLSWPCCWSQLPDLLVLVADALHSLPLCPRPSRMCRAQQGSQSLFTGPHWVLKTTTPQASAVSCLWCPRGGNM